MTNKTITLSREQVEKCLRDALIIRFSTDSHVEALRAALADTVPTAGGEPEEWCDKLHLLKVIQGIVATNRMRVERPTGAEAANAIYRTISEHLPIYEDVYDRVSELIEPLVARPHRPDGALPASVVGAVGVLLRDRTRLQAEVERLQKEADSLYDRRMLAVDELTKARELLAGARACVATNNRSNWSSRLLEAIDAFLSNQSAPADIGGDHE